MSLLEKACKIYDYEDRGDRVGVFSEGQEPMAPVSHLLTKAQIQITLSENGDFVSAETVAKNQAHTIIPVTPVSAGRTSSAKDFPHPLSDQLMFFSPGLG